VTVTATTKPVTLYFTAYSKRCPSNAAGQQIGYGVTEAGAFSACEPWANQAPYLKPRAEQVTVTDLGAPVQYATGAEARVADALLWVGQLPEVAGAARAVLDHLHAGRYASAIQAAVAAGYLK
jgi:hypothetical protein